MKSQKKHLIGAVTLLGIITFLGIVALSGAAENSSEKIVTMKIASDVELASAEGMAACKCYNPKAGDYCTSATPHYLETVDCYQSAGDACAIFPGCIPAEDHDTLETRNNDTASLSTTFCRSVSEGSCEYANGSWQCTTHTLCHLVGTRNYGTGDKCPWYM